MFFSRQEKNILERFTALRKYLNNGPIHSFYGEQFYETRD